MEDVRLAAVETAHIIATPDAFKADRTVKVLSLLEKESAVGPLAELDDDPGVLSWVALDVAQHVEGKEH